MYLTQKEKKNLAVKNAKNGKGVFARKDFKIGQQVVQILGVFSSGNIDEDIPEDVRSNMFRFDKDRYISPKGRIGDYFNHSCEPNVKIVKKDNKLFMVAIKPIQKGDEVVFDYSTIIASDDIWTMKCDCGSRLCRGIVKQFQKLPKKIRKFYISEKIVPKYILAL